MQYVFLVLSILTFGCFFLPFSQTTEKIPIPLILFWVGVGVTVVGALTYLITAPFNFEFFVKKDILYPFYAGCIWGLGLFFLVLTSKFGDIPSSLLATLVNTNTVPAVIIGLVVLKEYKTTNIWYLSAGVCITLFGVTLTVMSKK